MNQINLTTKNRLLSFSWVGLLLASFCLTGCSGSLITAHKFVLTIDMPAALKTEANIKEAFVDFSDQTRLVIPVVSDDIDKFAYGLGAFDETDVANLEASLRDTLQQAQLRGSSANARPDWNLHVVIRAYMEYGQDTQRHNLACIAWCLTGPEDRILFHEQFYTHEKLTLMTSVGDLKTKINKYIVSRVARRALILCSNPAQWTFNDKDDPSTYDSFEAAVKTLPDVFVKDLEFLRTEYRSDGVYQVYKDKGDLPGWESAQKGDSFDWPGYIRTHKKT
jgi:hypothetical protein